MSKNEIIQETGEILKELAFLMEIDDYPNTTDFIEDIVQLMRGEEYDIETCDRIKAKFMKLKQAKVLQRSVSDALMKDEQQ